MAERLTSDLLAGIPHGFSAREGLEAEDVLPGSQLVTVKQVHSATVETVSAPLGTPPPDADALVTATSGLALGIVTADCAPVLLADPAAGVIGAAHAGWRGAVGGVLGNTVEAMEELGANRSRIVAAIGPCIAQASYEVDAPFRAKLSPEDSRFFAEGREGRWQFDLPAYAAHRLAQAGVARVGDLARDTYREEALFHSYRRATHRGEASGGRQLSLIALR